MSRRKTGEKKVGNVGASATAVLKGCKDPEASSPFAHWMSTNPDAYTGLIKAAALYPAAKSLLTLPALTDGDAYFGGQKIIYSALQTIPAETIGAAHLDGASAARIAWCVPPSS